MKSAWDYNLSIDKYQEEIWNEDVPEALKSKVLLLNKFFMSRHIIWNKFDFERGKLSLYSSDFHLELNSNSGKAFSNLIHEVFISSGGRLVVELV